MGVVSAILRSVPWGRILPAALAMIVTACTPQLVSHRQQVPPGLEQLEEKVRQTCLDYERGIELLASGDVVMGRNLLDAATSRLAALAEQCSRLTDCDPGLLRAMVDGALGETGAAGARRGPPPAPAVRAVRQRGEEGSADSPFVGAIPALGRTVSLLRGTDLRELITLNGRVKEAMHDWLTWNRSVLVDAYENYQFLRHKMAPIYDEAGLPEALLFAMMAQEAGGKVHAWSRSGAAGPLQFMPLTARRYGLGAEDGFDMRLDPEASTRAAALYLNDQFTAFNENLEKTLAAYNAGESRLRRLNRRLDGAAFWDDEMYWALPRETRDYVPQIFAAAWLFLHPRDYGLDFREMETDTTEIVLAEGVAIDELSVCLGTGQNRNGWYRTLRNLNPRYRPGERIGAGTRIEMPSALVSAYARDCVGDAPLLARARELYAASREHERARKR